MTYYLHPLRKENIGPVTEIDQQAFPGQWPPPNYHHELENQLARYIVLCDESQKVEGPEKNSWMTSLSRWLGRDHRQTTQLNEFVVGFVGIWLMADEAHITAIAVREEYRGRGLGELLLLAIFDLTRELGANIATLEVRVSNTTAQSLYYKWGFTKVGVRQAYYTDNREDALIMSTPNINTPAFTAQLQSLKETYRRKWGAARFEALKEAVPLGRK